MVRLCQTVAQELGDGGSPDRLEEHRDAFITLATEGDFSSRMPRLRTLLAVAALLLVGMLSVLLWPKDDSIAFWVGQEKLAGKAGTWLEAPLNASFPVSFEQGSRVVLMDKSTARVASSTKREVAIDLSQGALDADIQGNRRTLWHVDAGPFRVTVLGTVFTVEWDIETKVLDVTVKRGMVLVRGAGLNEHGVRVQKGNHLRADSRTGFVSLNPIDSTHYDPEQPNLLASNDGSGPSTTRSGRDSAVSTSAIPGTPSIVAKPRHDDPSPLEANWSESENEQTQNGVLRHRRSRRSAGASTTGTSGDSRDPQHLIANRWPSERPLGPVVEKPTPVFKKIEPIVSSRSEAVRGDYWPGPSGTDGTLSQSDTVEPAPLDGESSASAEWLVLYNKGKYAAAVSKAEARGFQSLIESLDHANLWKLVDATRSAGRVHLSVDALSTYRERFGNKRKAKVATFLLGKIHFDQLGDEMAATKWFKKYLREDSNGPLAEEALGRLIRLCNNLGRTEEAQSAARQYLRKYPNGSFKDVARAIRDGL